MTTRSALLAAALLMGCPGCFRGEPVRPESSTHDAAVSAEAFVNRDSDRGEAKDIVQAAIRSHGGAALFEKALIGTTTMTIEGNFLEGKQGRCSVVEHFDLPDRHRRTVKAQGEGEDTDMVFVTNDDALWIQADGGEPRLLPVLNPGQGCYPLNILDSLLALEESDCDVLPAGSGDRQGRSFDRITADPGDGSSYDFFFDRESHLLRGTTKKVVDRTTGKSRVVETFYSDYSEVDGLHVPMLIRIVVDGEPWATSTVTHVEFLEGIDDAVFAKPVARKRPRSEQTVP